MKRKTLKLIKNKYILVLIVFFIFFIFIDDNSIITTYKLRKQLKELQVKQNYYDSECEKDSIMISKLRNDIQWIEKYGREQYIMKRDNEDVFIISRKKGK